MTDWKEARYTAARRFHYGSDANGEARIVYPGEYFDPAGLANDRLIFGETSMYTTVAPGGKREDWGCDRCGRHFLTESQLHHHQRLTSGVENISPERASELRKQTDARAVAALQSETMADLAASRGHQVEMRRSNRGGQIPVIRAG